LCEAINVLFIYIPGAILYGLLYLFLLRKAAKNLKTKIKQALVSKAIAYVAAFIILVFLIHWILVGYLGC
jgi:O-antigen ligase